MERKKYAVIGVSLTVIIVLAGLVYGSSTAFATSGSPKKTYFEFGETSLAVNAYEGTYKELRGLVGRAEEVTVYHTGNKDVATYLETVDYSIHAEQLGFLDKLMIAFHHKGTADNPVVLVEQGDLSITVVRENVFIVRTPSLDVLKQVFSYSTEHAYDFSAEPFTIKIPFNLQNEKFSLPAFAGINQETLRENNNMIFSMLRAPLINPEIQNLYLIHTPWETSGEENRSLTKGVAYISRVIGQIRPEMVDEKTYIITDLTTLDKLMLYMEIIGTKEVPVYCIRTQVDNANQDGIYMPREGFVYLEVENHENIEKYSMGLATILGGS